MTVAVAVSQISEHCTTSGFAGARYGKDKARKITSRFQKLSIEVSRKLCASEKKC
jgi:hypothetical protein